MEEDVRYDLRREADERAAAGAAIDRMVRGIHLDLANRYAERARSNRESARQPAAAVLSSQHGREGAA